MDESFENEIGSVENSDQQLLRLAAASGVYARGKRILGIQVSLTVLGGFLSSATLGWFPQLKVWAAFYSFAVALLEALVLEPHQSELRKRGARIQELFDCEVLRLPWRNLVAGEQPTPEDVTEEGAKYERKHSDFSNLKDWYSPAVSRISLPLARLVCQRTNAWWDLSLRRRYSACLKIILGILVIFVFALAIHRGMTIEVFVLAVVAPLTPAILWGVREIRKHSVAASDLHRLQDYIEKQWQAALKGTIAGDTLLQASASIQDEMFHFRSKNPFVFNWVYRLLRSQRQDTMHRVADQLVNEALHKGR